MLRSVVAVAAVSLLVSCGGGGGDAPVVADVADATSAKGDSRAQALALPPGTPVNIDAHLKGQFGPLKSWPVIPIHVALTADGVRALVHARASSDVRLEWGLVRRETATTSGVSPTGP